MRIALISYEYPPDTGFGGIGTYTHYHARALSRLGHEVHVFAGTQVPERRTYRDGNVTVTRLRKVGLVERMLPKLDRRGLFWFKNRLQNAANAFASLRRELVNGGFDVVEMPECGGEGALLSHCLDLPTVVRLHSPAELIMESYGAKAADRALTGMVERLGISGARAVSSCSGWLAQEVRRRGLMDRPISVIPNGIDLAVFDQDEGGDIHEQFGVPRDGLKVLFANRLERRKGVHVVKDMMVPVLSRNPDTTFVLAGADPDDVVGRELRPLLEEHGFGDRLLHLGRITLSEVRACLKQCDVFVLPSLWENAPYSLLEAMSAGKAIVASDCGGVPEMLRHEIDGIIAPTGDAKAFAAAITRLRNDDLRLRLGQSARARVEARFTADVVARRSLEFYQWALEAPGMAPAASASGPATELGPVDWFQTWWMRRGEPGERYAMAASMAGLGLEELGFVHAVLSRSYWSGHGRKDRAAVGFLGELAALHQERALRARDGGDDLLVSGTLGLPALSHPVFADDVGAEAVLAELWRLGDHEHVADWLVRESRAVGFVERATRRVALRRLAVEAFRRRPDDETAGVLRGIYRDAGSAARVVEKDREFVAEHPKGAEFGAVIEDLGLHAPLRRAAVFSRSRKRRRKSGSDAAVTVLIPSFRHEEFVAAAIESALAQTHENCRVLVVDDCSPDGTVAAARAVESDRLEVRSNDENLGLGGSVRAALPSIETPYVALLNSDDLLHPERLAKCLAVLEGDADATLVATEIAVMDDRGRRLTPANSCVLDVGRPAHDWVRWYDRVTAELGRDDWGELPALLRHNHLATSSNIVCRTSFLREHADSIAPLKYCLDWSLFLDASHEGGLRVLNERLLGYRLHGENTVWFDEQARPGYVHEVNAVVAAAVRRHAQRRRDEGVDPAALAEELAALLADDVGRHGEADGMALFLAELTAELGAVPAAFRAPSLARLVTDDDAAAAASAEAARRRVRIDRNAIEALRRSIKELAPRVGRLGEEVEALRDHREDVAAFRGRLDEERAAVAAQAAAAAKLREELEATAARAAGLEGDLARTREQLEQARGESARSEAARAETARALEELGAELKTTQRDLATEKERADGLVQELVVARAAVAAAEAALATRADEDAAARAEAEAARRELEGSLRDATERARVTAEELASTRRQLHDARLWAARRLVERRAAVEAVHRGFEFRVGRLLLHKLHLLGPLKTAARLATGARIGVARAFGGLRKSMPGRKPARVVFACADDFPSPRSGRTAALAAAVADRGFDARVLCFGAGGDEWLAPGTRSLWFRRTVIGRDAALHARDRRFFERRDPDAVAAIEQGPTLGGHAGAVFTFARSARAMAAGFLHGAGLDEEGVLVWGASRLLGVPYALRLEREDVGRLTSPGLREVAACADVLLVDGDALADRVRAALGAQAPTALIIPPAVALPRLPEPERGDRFVCIGPFLQDEGLSVLAEAAAAAVARGVDLRVDMFGAEVGPVEHVAALDGFRAMLSRLGILDRFVFHAEVDVQTLRATLADAGAVIDLRTGRGDDVAGVGEGVVTAMASGRPVVAFGPALRHVLGGRDQGCMVSAPWPRALADALTELANDADLRARLGRSARRIYEFRFASDEAAVELFARIRARLNARSS